MMSTQKLLDTLESLGATLRKPATHSQIALVEERLQCRLPDGVRDFYLHCDGLEDATSRWIWDFFSLNTLVERTCQRRTEKPLFTNDGDSLPYSDLVCFCDVLIDAPTYLFCANPSSSYFGMFLADQGCDGWMVADTYEAFVDLFVTRNDDVLLMSTNE